MELFGAYRAEINDPGDGTLLLSVEGLELRFVAVEPLYFRQVDGPFAMVFREDDRERITHMYTDFMPQYTTVKLHWYETTAGITYWLLIIVGMMWQFVVALVVLRRELGTLRWKVLR